MKTRKLFLLINSFIALAFASSQAQTISGTLSTDTTLDAASSPWRVTGDVVVENGVTLTIEPGCSLFFDSGVALQIKADGRLHAVGDEHRRITMTRPEDASHRWGGVSFRYSYEANKIGYADILHGDGKSQIIRIDHAEVVLDNLTWETNDRTVVEVNNPSAIIQGCIFPSIGSVEVVHGNHLEGDDYLILIGNTFGSPLGYNDVIDFSDCKRPGPIFEAYNNLFLGGTDDGLDMDGVDAHIEGNIFTGFKKDNTGSGTSNAIATGLRYGKTSDIVVVRNIFYDNEHAVLLKEDCSMIAENNTFVKCDSAVVNFSEWPYRSVDPGKGAHFSGNIFWNNRQLFENQFSHNDKPDPIITADYCLMDSAFHYLGENNIFADPMFVNPEGDFHLLAASPAIGAGPNFLDMGAYIPAGISISGEPADSTTATSAILHISGPGITDYRFSINDAGSGWSDVRSLSENPIIELNDLVPGESYRVFVHGKTFAGHWQDESEYAISKAWTVVYPTGVSMAADVAPKTARLYDNYPNPFNPSTSITFDLPRNEHVIISVFNALGQNITTLVDKELTAGSHHVLLKTQSWSSGVYYYKIVAGELNETKRMLLVR
jgi:hypothetical protein